MWSKAWILWRMALVCVQLAKYFGTIQLSQSYINLWHWVHFSHDVFVHGFQINSYTDCSIRFGYYYHSNTPQCWSLVISPLYSPSIAILVLLCPKGELHISWGEERERLCVRFEFDGMLSFEGTQSRKRAGYWSEMLSSTVLMPVIISRSLLAGSP